MSDTLLVCLAQHTPLAPFVRALTLDKVVSLDLNLPVYAGENVVQSQTYPPVLLPNLRHLHLCSTNPFGVVVGREEFLELYNAAILAQHIHQVSTRSEMGFMAQR